MPQRVSCFSAALASSLSPSLSPSFLPHSLSFLLHCLLAAVHFIICRQLLLLPHVPAASSILFFALLSFLSLSLALSLSLSLSVLHYASALAWPFAVVWGQLEPGSWSTGGSILSQALNLRASNCIKSVSSDLSLASLPPNSDTPLYPVQFFIYLPTPFVVCRSFSHS